MQFCNFLIAIPDSGLELLFNEGYCTIRPLFNMFCLSINDSSVAT